MAVFLAQLIFVLSAIQGLVMVFDELHYHRKRGLQKFERWGHLADTGLFLAAVLIPVLLKPDTHSLVIYGLLAGCSSLFITKDEWIHAKACYGSEHWCHALLFILHGPLLLASGLLWYLEPNSILLKALPVLTLLWGFYQFFYWNIHYDGRQQSTGRE